MQIANISTVTLYFTEKSGKVVEIAAGDAEPVDIDRDNVNVVARLNAKLIQIGGTEAQAKKVAREQSAMTPIEQTKARATEV